MASGTLAPVDAPSSPDALHAGWLKARSDLLRASVERAFALLSESRVEDEDWRTSVDAETLLWRAVRDAESPDVPTRFATVHRRGGEMLVLLADAGDALRMAVEQRDPELLGRAMERLDDALGAAPAFPERAAYERAADSARAQLGEPAFAAAWAAG